jgi:hypothetical protein
MDTEWNYWINEPIYVDKGVTYIVKRKHAYYLFCRDGLRKFLESYGYFFDNNCKTITVNLLRLMFHIWKGHRVEPICPERDFEEDQFDLYCHTLDFSEWEIFWKSWEGFQDFEPGTFGHEIQTMLPTFVWTWLDLDNSPATYALHKELTELMQEEEAAKGRDDPYLQETHTRDYQDRHWH